METVRREALTPEVPSCTCVVLNEKVGLLIRTGVKAAVSVMVPVNPDVGARVIVMMEEPIGPAKFGVRASAGGDAVIRKPFATTSV